jgi:bacillithiol biosynthesis cysteine-adding enzyme BshC
MFINFCDIPGHQNLFLDYLYEFENVKKYYKKNFRDDEEYKKIIAKLSSTPRDHKYELTEILKSQYEGLNASRNTLGNIQALSSPNTFVVATGQQLGIFGGPLYTFYKIITAIKLSFSLKEKFPEYNFVPVFWMPGDDHDFEEIKSINLIDQSNNLINISYNDGLEQEINRGGVGELKLNGGINETLAKLEESLRKTEFTAGLLDMLKSGYQEGKTVKEAFKKLLMYFFDEHGLVIFDPQPKEAKELLKELFKFEIENFRTTSKVLVETSADIEEIYHSQVKVRAINLFYSEGDGRYLIEPFENEFKLKGKRKKFTKEELLAVIDAHPEYFSPNVMLRPICQDYIFPTIAYVGGPGEISYFAQAIPLYDIYNVEQPIIYPRSSLTIIEKNISNIFEKYDITFNDLFLEYERLSKKAVSKFSDFNFEDIFRKAKDNISASFNDLQQQISAIDPTLSSPIQTSRDKALQNLDGLKAKAESAQVNKHESVLRQVSKAVNIAYPNSNLQERELNFIYFGNKYGPDFINKLYKEIAIGKFEHQTLEI